jgi:excisionase family DNA binding protein
MEEGGEPEKELTMQEACAELGVTRWTLMRWREGGKIQARKRGRTLLFPRSEIDKQLGFYKVSRGCPLLMPWFDEVSEQDANEGAELIAEVLQKTGHGVNPELLRPMIKGAEPVLPIFWNMLIFGLKQLLRPETPEAMTQAAEEITRHVQEWEQRGRLGDLWARSEVAEKSANAPDGKPLDAGGKRAKGKR